MFIKCSRIFLRSLITFTARSMKNMDIFFYIHKLQKECRKLADLTTTKKWTRQGPCVTPSSFIQHLDLCNYFGLFYCVHVKVSYDEFIANK